MKKEIPLKVKIMKGNARIEIEGSDKETIKEIIQILTQVLK